MKIEELDKNFKVETAENVNDVVFLDVRRDPFDVYGFSDYRTEPVFRRMSEKDGLAVSPSVEYLSKNTAGGRVRFSSDSPYIAIRCKWSGRNHMPHMPITGSSSFDLYIHTEGILGGKDTYETTFIVPTDGEHIHEGYTSLWYVNRARVMQSYTIHFPLYNDVTSLEIGVAAGSNVDHGAPYRPADPIVYYGSSITQGGCASRPGNAYQNIISARLNIDHRNLGFSGNAKGEEAMARYIAALPMSVFVYDYDHNAPTAEYLKKTHEPFFQIIREAHPTLPVIMVSRPKGNIFGEEYTRREVIYQTYKNAREAGDRNVYFVDGSEMFGDLYRDLGTVDGCHPNDYGFVCMADAIGGAIVRALSK